jgi:hypothetical protein
MIYYVSPICDQLDWDEGGPVDRSLFAWATDASEAIKLWRAYYEENRPAAIRKSGERWRTLANAFPFLTGMGEHVDGRGSRGA